MNETTIVKISSIKNNPNNPRLVKDDKFKKLVNSIKEFPQMLNLRPIVVNDDMIVLGGNMRLKACVEAGLKEVPIIKASDLTEEQQRQFIIKDNLGYGEWDWDMIANEWDVEQLDEWGLDVPNFDAGELDDLSEQIQPSFRIEIFCKDEEHQEKTYNKLIADGLECKLLTL
jgi:ParB-like chromosome segregation protein Spo0J